MRRMLVCAFAVLAFSALVAAPAAAKQKSGIAGTVTVTGCGQVCIQPAPQPDPCPPCTTNPCPLRPCILPPSPCLSCPTPAPGVQVITVTIARLSSGEMAAVRHPTDGKFSVRLRPGRYTVTANTSSGCSPPVQDQVRVKRGRMAQTALTLQNACAVQPTA